MQWGGATILRGMNADGEIVDFDSRFLIDNDGNRHDIPAGFYASAYRLDNGEMVISYRGTDQPFLDPLTGWTVGAGNPTADQGLLAIAFY